MRRFFNIFILLIATYSTVFSQELNKTEPTTESWYTYWGLGYANINYPAGLQHQIDDLKNQGGENNMSLYLDILGFYLHLTPKTIVGVILNITTDRFEIDRRSMQINQYIYSASVMHYTGNSF